MLGVSNLANSSGTNVKNNYKVNDFSCVPCFWSGNLNVIYVTDDDEMLLESLLIMLQK